MHPALGRPELAVFDVAIVRVEQRNWKHSDLNHLCHITVMHLLASDGSEVARIAIHGDNTVLYADGTGGIPIVVDAGNTGTPLPAPSPEAPE
ncbi:MAG TPA: hypothetical protein VGN75_01220 [Kaistia sp.]|jgi:hypothetical protein|nr:hypothetical protein [Kaistia sp.]